MKYNVERRFHNLLRQWVYVIQDVESFETVGIIFDTKPGAAGAAWEAAERLENSHILLEEMSQS